MSLIGLLTTTEKQVYLDRLHMRPIQWHLKNNCRVPESLEKVIPIPTSLHSHLEWWSEEDNVLQGQPLHPLKHALQIFTDASKEGWGAHLNEHTATAKGRKGIPSWNLSLVLHQLTKAPFEPLREASLKLLTFKTVFLLALGSGKRRSEIHAWQNRNIRHQSDWSKVSLYPSPSFLSKNQLAKEGPESVVPVVIPALAPTLDKSLKSDRSLCPVRTLRYYLDRTSDLGQNKELVFVSFKKGFDKDISPATIYSWIKQTVILCYELSDQESHTLHQVKAHDVRALPLLKPSNRESL